MLLSIFSLGIPSSNNIFDIVTSEDLLDGLIWIKSTVRQTGFPTLCSDRDP